MNLSVAEQAATACGEGAFSLSKRRKVLEVADFHFLPVGPIRGHISDEIVVYLTGEACLLGKSINFLLFQRFRRGLGYRKYSLSLLPFPQDCHTCAFCKNG